jgi:hypothetical protein
MGDQTLTDAVHSLEEARDLLLQSSQHAGSQHDWTRARQLFDLAEQIGKLRDLVEGVDGGSQPPSLFEQAERALQTQGEASPSPRRSGRPSDYPKFAVRGAVLVKTGLQRNGRDVYEHSIPKEQFDKFLSHLKSMAASRTKSARKPFKADDLQEAIACPQYMVFIVLLLLLREGLLQRVRRGVYVFASPEGFATSAAGLWDRLRTETA